MNDAQFAEVMSVLRELRDATTECAVRLSDIESRLAQSHDLGQVSLIGAATTPQKP
jgi:hypothetical protein